MTLTGEPESERLISYNNWKNESNVMSGTLVCYAISRSAAPPYYAPNLNFMWILPTPEDGANYSAIPSHEIMQISGLDCTEGKQPPVYCSASEEGLEGERVAGYPSDKCGTRIYRIITTIVIVDFKI